MPGASLPFLTKGQGARWTFARRRGDFENMGLIPHFKDPCVSASFCRDNRQRIHGAALVLVLLMTTVLVVLVTVFLALSSKNVSTSASAVALQKVDVLSNTVWQLVVSNLQTEILAGSVNPQAPALSPTVPIDTPVGPGKLLFPSNEWAAVPSRNAPVSQPNLVKWSSRGSPFYKEAIPGTYPWSANLPPAVSAAPVSCADASANGMTVLEKRWRTSWLLSEIAPVPTPDWCLLNNRGENRLNLLTNTAYPIVARYAFMIFDEGGLADVSVAGFPSGTEPSVVAGKGTPRLIDLKPLLAEAGMTGAEAATFNDALVRWRDFGTLGRGDYAMDILTKPFGIPGRLNSANRSWVGRSGLIRMVRGYLPGSLDARQKFLQYAGTFSRSIEQPSLQPPQPRSGANTPPPIRSVDDGGNDAWGWDAEPRHSNHSQHLNPPFLQVRVVVPFVRRDGTQALKGEPLVPRRFPLSRLAVLGNQTVAGLGSAVANWFGLTRESAGEPWIYRQGQGKIKTLYEVANPAQGAPRDPDFIELLKAAIQAGSLAPHIETEGEEWKKSLDCAVIQIAANLIDQYDADDIPTRIAFDAGNGTEVFSGIENLPYFHGIRTCVSTLENQNPMAGFLPPDGKPSSLFIKTLDVPGVDTLIWQKVELWNPHSLGSGGVPGRPPRLCRLVVSTDKPLGLRAKQAQPMVVPGIGVIPGESDLSAGNNIKPEGEQFRFTDDAASRVVFHLPVWVDSLSEPPELQVVRGMDNIFPAGDILDSNHQRIFGVGLAAVPRAFAVTAGIHAYNVLPSVFTVEPGTSMTYRLEFLQSASEEEEVWVKYDEKIVPLQAEIPVDSFSLNVEGALHLFPDPRTSRLGPVIQQGVQTEADLRATFFNNSGADPSGYSDADGVVRRGMGAASPNASPLDEVARPRLLNRAFRSVGEMAFAFSGNPWKQLDFSTPESGFGGLLDVFSVSEFQVPGALTSGRINLNTRQLPVLKAALSGATRTVDAAGVDSLSLAERDGLAAALLSHTSRSPLRNLSDLVGRWKGGASLGGRQIGRDLYDGFASDLGGGLVGEQARQVGVRALADVGQTRVWNLFIDLIVQAGRYPSSADAKGNLRSFVVEADRRIWVHVALDRLTGDLLDSQVEIPPE